MDIDKIEELTNLTRQWFIDRDITQGDIFKQTLKLFEEMGELCAGYVKQKRTAHKGQRRRLRSGCRRACDDDWT